MLNTLGSRRSKSDPPSQVPAILQWVAMFGDSMHEVTSVKSGNRITVTCQDACALIAAEAANRLCRAIHERPNGIFFNPFQVFT